MSKKLLIMLSVIMILIGCQKPAEDIISSNENKIKIADMKGNLIELDKLPERIISLSPSNTEIVFALKSGDKLVGITNFCDYPAETADIDKIGDFDGPNIELIKKAQPDVILAGVYLQGDLIIALENLGIPIITTEASDFEDIPQSIDLIGKLVGKEKEAEKINYDMQKAINEMELKTKDLERVDVFYLAWIESLITTGKGTFVDDVIRLAGARNVAEEVDGWTHYSIEELIKQNPDMLIVASHATNEGVAREEFMNDAILSNIECVRNGNFYIMKDDNLISRPGPRIIEGINEMYKAIHER